MIYYLDFYTIVKKLQLFSTYTIIRYFRVRCSYRKVNTEQIEKIGLATFSRQKLHFRLWFYTTAQSTQLAESENFLWHMAFEMIITGL